MRYAYFVIGVLVLIILVGLIWAFNNQGKGPVTGAYVGSPYEASVLNSGYGAYPAVPAGYPVAYTATSPVVPTVWYTAPTQMYYYPTANTRATVVYPTSYTVPQAQYYSYGTNTSSYTVPGQTQTYSYTTPTAGSNYSYQYQYGPNGQIYYAQP